MTVTLNLQEKVVFVTCEDDDKIVDAKKLEGKYVRLSFGPYFCRISFLLHKS